MVLKACTEIYSPARLEAWYWSNIVTSLYTWLALKRPDSIVNGP